MATIRPYVHSPEEGTAEAEAQPWAIHIPVEPMPWPEEEQPLVLRAPPAPVEGPDELDAGTQELADVPEVDI